VLSTNIPQSLQYVKLWYIIFCLRSPASKVMRHWHAVLALNGTTKRIGSHFGITPSHCMSPQIFKMQLNC
jgi:hypothetical protein